MLGAGLVNQSHLELIKTGSAHIDRAAQAESVCVLVISLYHSFSHGNRRIDKSLSFGYSSQNWTFFLVEKSTTHRTDGVRVCAY